MNRRSATVAVLALARRRLLVTRDRQHHFGRAATDYHRAPAADHRTTPATNGSDLSGIRRG